MNVHAGDGRDPEALARYCLLDPVNLARLPWSPGSQAATDLPRDGHDDDSAENLDTLDFVARLLAHVPNPRRHLVHDCGAWSNVVRGKLMARIQARRAEPLAFRPNLSTFAAARLGGLIPGRPSPWMGPAHSPGLRRRSGRLPPLPRRHVCGYLRHRLSRIPPNPR